MMRLGLTAIMGGWMLGIGPQTAHAAPVEFCNGRDDDGNGTADEPFPCVRDTTMDCVTPDGFPGRATCGAACQWSTCRPVVEVCDGRDNDANGTPDDAFECALGTARRCDGGRGHQRCLSDCRWGPCVIEERCNHRDDDGDGLVDEGVPYPTRISKQSEYHPGMSVLTSEGADCTDDRLVVMVDTLEGERAFTFDNQGTVLGGTPILCHRTGAPVGADFNFPVRREDRPGGTVVPVGDHFIAACIGWPTAAEAVQAGPPPLLVFRLSHDGEIVELAWRDDPVERDGLLWAAGPPDLDVTDGGILVASADYPGPRRHNRDDPSGTAAPWVALLDLDGHPIGGPTPIAMDLMGDDRTAIHIRGDENGAVLFARDGLGTDGAPTFFHSRVDLVTGELSERWPVFDGSTYLDTCERFGPGWFIYDSTQVAALFDGATGTRTGPMIAPGGVLFRNHVFHPYSVYRGRAFGDEIHFSHSAGTMFRVGTDGYLVGAHGAHERPRPTTGVFPNPVHLPEDWVTVGDAACERPDGGVASFVVSNWRRGALVADDTPVLLEFTLMNCDAGD